MLKKLVEQVSNTWRLGKPYISHTYLTGYLSRTGHSRKITYGQRPSGTRVQGLQSSLQDAHSRINNNIPQAQTHSGQRDTRGAATRDRGWGGCKSQLPQIPRQSPYVACSTLHDWQPF